jgi:hypothetical protein
MNEAPTAPAHRFLAVSAYRNGHRAFCTCGWRQFAPTVAEANAALDRHMAAPAGTAARWTGTGTFATCTVGRLVLTVHGEPEDGVTFPFAAYVATDGDAPELVGMYRTLTAAKIAASTVARNVGR